MRAPTIALAGAVALACATGCRHRRAPRPRPVWTWRVAPAEGAARRVFGGDVVVGGLRVRNGVPAPMPYTAAPIVATARMADGSWRFATGDGAVFAASDFTGPLRRVAELPGGAVDDADLAARHGLHNTGLLVVRDRIGGAQAVDADGGVRTLPLRDVIDACATDARTVLAVTEPGALWRSEDGGRSFGRVRPPAGFARALWLVDDVARVRTTAGTFVLRGSELVPDETDVTAAQSLAVPPEVVAAARGRVTGAPFDLAPGRSASPDGRTVFTLRGDRFVILDARGRVRTDEPAPGTQCELYRAWRGVGAVCRHAWARVVLARRTEDPGWRVLRDERDGAPVGERVVFDRWSAAWATDAPCRQRAQEGAARLCATDAQGVAHEVAREGTLLAMDRERVVLRDGAGFAVRDVEGRERGRVAFDAAVPAAGDEAVSTPRGLVVIARGPTPHHAWTEDGTSWRAIELPDARVALTDDDALITWSADLSALHRSSDLRTFTPLPAPVDGATITLSTDEPLRCVAGWCALGPRVILTDRVRGEGRALARAQALSTSVSPRPMRTIRCEHGAESTAEEIDRGAASTGYAVSVALSAPNAVTVTWRGDRARGSVSGAIPLRPNASLAVRGVALATQPAALVERCNDRGCDHLFATRAGLADLRLGRRRPGGVEVHAFGEGFVVRTDEDGPEGAVVTLARVQRDGVPLWRRSYVLARGVDAAAAGTWGGRDGLWIANPLGRMRFHPLDGSESDVTVPAPDASTGPCALRDHHGATSGEARWIHTVPVVRGPGWYLERGRWQHEAVIEVSEGGACIAAMGAGEPHDEAEAPGEEREPVRSFALTPADGGYTGEAWSGRRRIALRCNAVE